VDAEMTITEQWKPTKHEITERVEKSVRLVGAPTITVDGGPCTPVSITFRFFRINGGRWQPQITIYADRPGYLVRKFFSPHAVYQPPQWLTDLIAREAPEG
jgi:hypothetical protein